MHVKRKCLFCNDLFLPNHGNQQYCCLEHKTYQKAANQHKLYGILKDFRKEFLNNYKLLEQLLTKPGNKTMRLAELTSYGFKTNCYFGSFINDSKETFYKIAEYHFRIFIENKDYFIKIVRN